jgi:hypothetical protein
MSDHIIRRAYSREELQRTIQPFLDKRYGKLEHRNKDENILWLLGMNTICAFIGCHFPSQDPDEAQGHDEPNCPMVHKVGGRCTCGKDGEVADVQRQLCETQSAFRDALHLIREVMQVKDIDLDEVWKQWCSVAGEAERKDGDR